MSVSQKNELLFQAGINFNDLPTWQKRGIGFVRMGAVKEARVIAISTDGREAILPTPATVARETYPLVRRLYLYTTSATNHPLTKDFVDFVLSREGQEIVAANGFVPR